jgi:hypothetical protein
VIGGHTAHAPAHSNKWQTGVEAEEVEHTATHINKRRQSLINLLLLVTRITVVRSLLLDTWSTQQPPQEVAGKCSHEAFVSGDCPNKELIVDYT